MDASSLGGDGETTGAPLLTAGTLLSDRYVVESVLGSGGFGTVYAARDTRLGNRRVAVKALSPESTRDPWRQKKFRQEMEALARLDHPGIVTVLDTGLAASGAPFLVMQLVEGQSLRAALKAGPLSYPRASSILRQVGDALEAAHARGVLHRDLKPENIMVPVSEQSSDPVKLIDFGIASLYQPGTGPGDTGVVAGSTGYMAPEQYEGKVSPASDVYSFGMVAYEVLTARFPFSLNSGGAIVFEQLRGLRKKPSEARHGLPPEIDDELTRALSPHPAERHQSPAALAGALVRALSAGDSIPTTAIPASTPRSSSGASRSGIEIGHVIFIEIAGYAQLPIDQQSILSSDLRRIVAEGAASASAAGVEMIPFAEGAAAVFSGDPVNAVECAMETAREAARIPGLKLRTAIHSGPVSRASGTVVGSGVLLARRTVELAGAGQILVSQSLAAVLLEISGWRDLLLDAGEHSLRDGARLRLYNLVTGEVGSTAALTSSTPAAAGLSRRALAASAAGAVAAAAGGYWLYRRGTAAPPVDALAVFPFARLKSDDLDFLADGIAEELIDRLARFPGLRVTAFSAVSRYRGDPANLAEVASTFGVGAVLTGRIGKKGEALAVSAELVGVRDQRRLWGKRTEWGMAATPSIAAELSSELAVALQTPGAGQEHRSYTPSNPAAHRLYLQGRFFWNKRTAADIRKSIGYFQQAIEADPVYPIPYCGLADAYSALGGVMPPAEAFPKARAYVTKALEIAPDLPDAHASAGLIDLLYEWDWPRTERSFRHALELNPNHMLSRVMYSRYLAAMGRFDEAVAQLETARRLDPVDLGIGNHLGNTLMLARRYDAAARELRKTLEMDPAFTPARINLGSVLAAQGDLPGAIRELGTAVAKVPQNAGALSELARVSLLGGRRDEASGILKRLDELATKQFVAPHFLAVGRIGAAPAEALGFLESSYEVRYWALVYLKVDPRFDPLRQEPRFQALIQKMKL